MRRLKSGFTLIELMVALGIMGLVMVLVAQAFTAQQRAYFAVEDTSETQQNSNIVKTVMDTELRHAGFMVPPAAAVCAMDNVPPMSVGVTPVQPGTDVLWVSASGLEVIDPLNDLLTRKTVSGENLINTELGARVTSTYAHGTGMRSFVVDALSIDNPASPLASSDFAPLQGVILVREQGNSVLACGQIAGTITGFTIPAQIIAAASADNPGDGPVMLIPAHVYYVAPPSAANGNQPTLMRDAVAFVPGVEDFQVAVFFDGNSNRLVDAGEYRGGTDNSTYDFFNVASASYVVVEEIREVRTSFVTRSLAQQQGEGLASGFLQNLENHVVSGPADRFLRRAVSTTAWLRNVAEREKGGI